MENYSSNFSCSGAISNSFETYITRTSKEISQNTFHQHLKNTPDQKISDQSTLYIKSGFQSGGTVTVKTSLQESPGSVVSFSPEEPPSYETTLKDNSECREDCLVESITNKISNLHTCSNYSEWKYRKSPPKYEEAIAYLNLNKHGIKEKQNEKFCYDDSGVIQEESRYDSNSPFQHFPDSDFPQTDYNAGVFQSEPKQGNQVDIKTRDFDNRTTTRRPSMRTIGKSYSLDEDPSVKSKRKTLKGKKSSSFELTGEENSSKDASFSKNYFTPIKADILHETTSENYLYEHSKPQNKRQNTLSLPNLSKSLKDSSFYAQKHNRQVNKRSFSFTDEEKIQVGTKMNHLEEDEKLIVENKCKNNFHFLIKNNQRESNSSFETNYLSNGNSQNETSSKDSNNLVIRRLLTNEENSKMHLDCYSSFSLSPEPSLPDLSPFDFDPLSSSSIFSPPKINIEAPSESDLSSSLLSSSTAITGALEELHSDVYLTGEEWVPSLDNFLTSLHENEPLMDNTVLNENSTLKPLEASKKDFFEDPSCLLDIPMSHSDELEKYLGPSRSSISPMSVSPVTSSAPSPFPSLRSSLRRHKRSHSSSPHAAEGMDFNTIIRSSPSCLTVTDNHNMEHPNLNEIQSCGTYGHILPRPELNNNELDNSSLSFHSLLVDESLNEKFPNENTSSNFAQNSPMHLENKMTEPFHTILSPGEQVKTEMEDSISVHKKTTQEEEKSESLEEEDCPRQCRWVDCNITFANREALSRHIERSHIDQRKGDDFTCFWAACQRRYRPFNARYKLLIHMRVHSGEKPNKCTFKGCTKAFSRLENLKIHLRSHTGERPYICVYQNCNKAFSNSSDRAKHQRTHVDAKPYVCSVPGCKKRYTDPSSLRKHVKNHSSKEQALAKRKAQKDDSMYSSPIEFSNNCKGASTFSSNEKNFGSRHENHNGRIFHGVVSGVCSPIQSSLPCSFQTPFGGSPGGHPDSSGISGGSRRLGEHVMSLPSPPLTPNYDTSVTSFQQSYPHSNIPSLSPHSCENLCKDFQHERNFDNLNYRLPPFKTVLNASINTEHHSQYPSSNNQLIINSSHLHSPPMQYNNYDSPDINSSNSLTVSSAQEINSSKHDDFYSINFNNQEFTRFSPNRYFDQYPGFE